MNKVNLDVLRVERVYINDFVDTHNLTIHKVNKNAIIGLKRGFKSDLKRKDVLKYLDLLEYAYSKGLLCEVCLSVYAESDIDGNMCNCSICGSGELYL